MSTVDTWYLVAGGSGASRAQEMRCAATTVSISPRAVRSAAIRCCCEGNIVAVIATLDKEPKTNNVGTKPLRPMVSFIPLRHIHNATLGWNSGCERRTTENTRRGAGGTVLWLLVNGEIQRPRTVAPPHFPFPVTETHRRRWLILDLLRRHVDSQYTVLPSSPVGWTKYTPYS